MKKITLTQGKFALVDDEDFDKVSKYKWSLSGNKRKYAGSYYKSKWITMHRIIMNPTKDQHIDHIDGDVLNNQRYNLRLCTNQQNTFNSKSRPGTSKFKGVSWTTREQKWRAVIMLDNKQTHIGYFDSELHAAKAYNKMALKYFGEFARLNGV